MDVYTYKSKIIKCHVFSIHHSKSNKITHISEVLFSTKQISAFRSSKTKRSLPQQLTFFTFFVFSFINIMGALFKILYATKKLSEIDEILFTIVFSTKVKNIAPQNKRPNNVAPQIHLNGYASLSSKIGKRTYPGPRP